MLVQGALFLVALEVLSALLAPWLSPSSSFVAVLFPPPVPRPEEGIPELLALMDKYVGVAELQTRGCLSLVGTLVSAPDEMFMPASESIAAALRNHGASNSAVAGLCCAALVEVIGRIHAADASTSSIVDGALAAAVGSIESNLGHPHVCAECLRVVWLLAVPPADKARVAEAATDVVVKALGAHGAAESMVAEYGAGALWSFTSEDVTERQRVLTRGGAPVLISALNGHLDDGVVVKQAAGALWSLAAQPGNTTEVLMRLGAGGALVGALRKHMRDTSVAETVFGALHSLAASESNRDALSLLGAVEAVQESMRLFAQESDDSAFIAKGVRCVDKILSKDPVPEAPKIVIN